MPGVTASIPKAPTITSVLPSSGGPPAYWASVSGLRVVRGTLSVPLYGAWVADVVLATDQTLPAAVSLTVGNLTLAGAVYRQAPFAGLLEARLVGGAGGWSQSVEARGYDNPGGVLASQVLADAALEVGEQVVVASDRVLGNYYVRLADKASRVLRAIAGEQWWIDPAGVTHVGPRGPSSITSDFVVEEFSGASGRLRIATEDPASWQPGATFSSATVAPQTIASVRHVFADSGIARLEVMVSASNDRWFEEIRQMIRDELAASMAYARIWEYQVVDTDGIEIQALPVDQTAPVPPLTGLQLSGGLGALPALGSRIAVGFLDADPAKPVLLGSEGLLASFVQQFLTWVPVPNDGGAALKTLLTAWQAQNLISS